MPQGLNLKKLIKAPRGPGKWIPLGVFIMKNRYCSRKIIEEMHPSSCPISNITDFLPPTNQLKDFSREHLVVKKEIYLELILDLSRIIFYFDKDKRFNSRQL